MLSTLLESIGRNPLRRSDRMSRLSTGLVGVRIGSTGTLSLQSCAVQHLTTKPSLID